MAEQLKGRAVCVEKAETLEAVLSAAEALADLNPSFGRPGRKLGL